MLAKTTKGKLSQRWYRGANIPARVIRQFVRAIAQRFRPDKIILFGSHAYGKPHQDSDVDLLVIMPALNTTDMAIKIQLALMPPFPVDLIVRTPMEIAWRLASFSQKLCLHVVAHVAVNHGVVPRGTAPLPIAAITCGKLDDELGSAMVVAPPAKHRIRLIHEDTL